MSEVLAGHIKIEDCCDEDCNKKSKCRIPVYVDDTKIKVHELPDSFYISTSIMLRGYHFDGGLLRVERS